MRLFACITMVRGMHKSKTFRRVKVKTPGNRISIHYKERKPKKLVCPNCSTDLKGTLRLRPIQQSKVSRSQKRSERAYSNLCARCAKKTMISKGINSKLNS